MSATRTPGWCGVGCTTRRWRTAAARSWRGRAESTLGYAVWALEPTPWPATFVTSRDAAELHTLLVRPEARGQGIGSALLDDFEAWLVATGTTDAVIGVVPANARAIALYRRRGFEPDVADPDPLRTAAAGN